MEKKLRCIAYFDVGVPGVDAQQAIKLLMRFIIAEISRLGNGDPVSLGIIQAYK